MICLVGLGNKYGSWSVMVVFVGFWRKCGLESHMVEVGGNILILGYTHVGGD